MKIKKRPKVITIRVPDDFKERLEIASKHYQLSITDIIEKAVDEALIRWK